MKYRVILAFEGYSVGQVIEPTGLWAGELKRRGYIEPLLKEVTSIKYADAAGTVQTIQPKRGRPRKDDVHRV